MLKSTHIDDSEAKRRLVAALAHDRPDPFAPSDAEYLNDHDHNHNHDHDHINDNDNDNDSNEERLENKSRTEAMIPREDGLKGLTGVSESKAAVTLRKLYESLKSQAV